jgi:hypothetical protein
VAELAGSGSRNMPWTVDTFHEYDRSQRRVFDQSICSVSFGPALVQRHRRHRQSALKGSFMQWASGTAVRGDHVCDANDGGCRTYSDNDAVDVTAL